ncbi:hypothetical protein [Streptomyces asoensis]|uniref:hypothetical protein n=1 Tax=Streptomyces asoensis TaxID=249586 RepID=UPI0033C78AAA
MRQTGDAPDRAAPDTGTSHTVRPPPAAGEIVLLDRSWYHRAGVERVGSHRVL